MNNISKKGLLLVLTLFPILLYSQSEGGFGFRRFANKAALDATSVNNSGKSESRRAYVHSTGLYYVWDGSTWIAEIAIDTFAFANDTLTLSLLRDGVPAKKVRIEAGQSLIDTVYDYDDLRAYAGASPLVFVKKVGIRGLFLQNNQGLALDDNGINITGNDEWVRYGEDTTMVNVKWFEAVGDSITDDNTALQAALSYCLDHPGSTLYFPSGKYRYTSQLFAYKPVDINIKGDGMNQTYLLPQNVNGIYFRTDSTTTVTDGKYGLAEMRDFQISDLSMLRVGTNNYANKVVGLYLRGGFNTKLENVRVEEFFASAGGGIGGIGIRLDNTIPGDVDAVQHTTFDNVWVAECDTGIVTRLHNTMIWHDVKVDQSKKFGVVLRNGVYWNKGMVQGSENCGIFFDQNGSPFVLQDIHLEDVYFEANGYNAPRYGTLYKPSNVNANTINITHCTFTGSQNSKLFNLRRVINSSIIHNRYSGNTTDTLSLTSFYNVKFGGDNYYALALTTSDCYIHWISGNGAGLTQEWVGQTIAKGTPGDYALTVGGSAIVDDSLAIGATNPTAKLDVNGISRLRSVTGIVPTTLSGRDASGYVGTVSVGTGLSLSGGTLSNTVTNTNIYTDNGTTDDTTRTLTILENLRFTGTGTDDRFRVDLYRDGSGSVASENTFAPTFIQLSTYYNSMSTFDYTSSYHNTNNPVAEKYYELSNGGAGEGSEFLIHRMLKDSAGISDYWNVVLRPVPALVDSNYNSAITYLGKNTESASGQVYSHRYRWGVQLKESGADTSNFNFIRVDLDESIFKNSIWFYDKYRFLNQTPSETVGDTSLQAWVGNGVNTTPIWIDKDQFGGGGTNIYNSNGTTTQNSRILTIRPGGTLTFTATDSTGGKYPFRVLATGNEPEFQLWKGNTDSAYIKMSDVDYLIGSSATFVVYSEDALYHQADSIIFQGIGTETKMHYVSGLTSGGTIKRIQGTSSGDVISWNTAGYWEVTAGGSGGDGIYGGSGNIPDNTVATVAANGDFQIAYDGGNPAFEVDDALNQAYISGQSGTYSVYADNSNSGLVSGTATWLVGSDFALTASADVANTNTAADRLIIQTNSSGTVNASFGGSILFRGESSTTDNRDMISLVANWSTVTDATRTSKLDLYTVNSGGALTNTYRFAPGSWSLNTSAGAAGLTLTPSVLTTTTSFTLGNSASALTLGGSNGLISISSSSTNANAISIASTANGGTNTSGIDIGNSTSFTQTSGVKNYMKFTEGFAPTSGTGEHNQLAFLGTFNQTGGASGVTRGIYVNNTLTAVADFRAIDVAVNSSSAKGIYQTGSSTTNNLVGKTRFGGTTTPDDQLEIEGNLELVTAGNKLKIATGANASMGTATLVGGTVTVNTTAVATGSTIFISYNTFGGTPGSIEVPSASITNATSFVINSSSALDASTVNWIIVN